MQWFRFYSEALDDPKVQRLPGDLFKAWVNLLCLANEADERGTLPDVADIAFRLRLDDQKTADALRGLCRAGLLDGDADDGYSIHAWDKRQPDSDSSTERVRRHRAKKQQETAPATGGNSSETLPKRSSNALDKNRVEENRVDQTRGEESGRVLPLAQAPRPAPKRADARPTLPNADDLFHALVAWAHEKGLSAGLRDEIERFRDYCLTKLVPATGLLPNGKPLYLDYAAACRKWITNPNYQHGPQPLHRASPNGKVNPVDAMAALARQFREEEARESRDVSGALDATFTVRAASH